MTSNQIGALVDGLVPLIGGILATLLGFGVIGKRRNADLRYEQWYARFGPVMRVTGPVLIIFGLWRTGSALISSSPSQGATTARESITKSSAYFPAKVGSSWTYQASGSLITVRITAIEPIHGKDCFRQETSIDGKEVITAHLRPEGDALMKYTLNGGLYLPPIPLLYVTATSPVKWEYQSANGNVKLSCEQRDGGAVEVPYGRYDRTILVTMHGKVKSNDYTLRSWYVEGVGIVREHEQDSNSGVLFELKNFSQPDNK